MPLPVLIASMLLYGWSKGVAVYDAEDRPEPGQLRQALDAFRNGPPMNVKIDRRGLQTFQRKPQHFADGVEQQTEVIALPLDPDSHQIVHVLARAPAVYGSRSWSRCARAD